jgi:CYTH domain-containing protein
MKEKNNNYFYFLRTPIFIETIMHTEIERKFLVSGEFQTDAAAAIEIVQGYLSRAPERTVRVRIKGDSGYLTIKGKTSDSGMTRLEWEKEISAEEARELLLLCEPFLVFKTRYLVPFAGHTFEVDVFHDNNEGLVLAEIEFGSTDENFEKPLWLGEEVTGDMRYYNSYLSVKPYKLW